MKKTRVTISVPSVQLLEAIRPLDDSYEVGLWDLTGPPPYPRLSMVVLPYQEDPARMSALGEVSADLVQAQTIGYEDIVGHLPPGATLANASSVHEASTAELAIGLVLAALRRIPDYVRAADAGVWEQLPGTSLADRTVAIIGYGGIGQAIDRRLEGFETTVLRFARSARPDPDRPVLSLSDFGAHAAGVDVVILSVPLVAATRQLVDDAFLAALPDGALIVNVARGAVVDTDALLHHLQRGRIRAALDVTDPEPLPADHPLWREPNALVTPHVGGASSAMTPRVVALIKRQIDALRAGREPENVVARA
jgi:phosphoglycerate dehydrogenase-like enzyme